MAESGPFPLLVEGSWGLDPPKTLINKLQMYFQSRKKSGGGECEVVPQPGSPASFLVLFSPEDVRQNVLKKENHELVWPGKGTFKLTVRLFEDSEKASVSKEAVPEKESETKKEAPEKGLFMTMRHVCSWQHQSTSKGRWASKRHLMEFDSHLGKKRILPGLLHNGQEEPAERGLLNLPKVSSDDLDTAHSPSNRTEDVLNECETVSSMVAFENLPEKVTDIVLTILVENISGFPSDDFKVEVIRDFGVAVVTFQKPIDTKKFIIDCISHHSNRQLQLAPRLLETTNVVRVENLPPGVDDYQLQLYFENPFNGGGRVTQVECFPEESSALVEFSDSKVLDTILAKTHSFNRMPLSVFPYYPSLGTALYGEEKPLVKLPASFQESLGLPLWKFFQKNNHLIEEINDKMRRCHCELTWSDINGTVTVRPAATLVNHRPSIKTWQRDASEVLSGIKAKYEIKVFEVYPPVWDIIQHEVGDDRVLIEFDKESLTLAGKSEDVQDIGQKIKELIDSTTEKVRKEEQSLKENVAISPGKHFLLEHSGFLDDLRKENPEMEIHYDAATQHLCFKGFRADVYKVKCDIQEKVYSMPQKDVPIPSEVFMFLQQVHSQEFSKTLFEAQKILATYELNGTALLLMACSFRALAEAEKKMLDALSYKIIDVEDKEVFRGNVWKRKIHLLQKGYLSTASIMIKNELTSGTPAEVIIAGCVKEVNEIHGQLFEFLENTMKIERLVEIEPLLIIEYLRADKTLFWPKIRKANVQARFKVEDEPKGILLTGYKSKVLECMDMVRQIRDSVCIKRFQIDKPGARQFFQDKASYYKSEIKRLYGCIIELQEGAEKDKVSLKEQKCLLQKDIAPGVTLIVQQGDLARFPADVVVNAANEHLKHIDGLALALSNAAGPELQAECDKIVRNGGVVKTGNAVTSKPGKLPCHHVIHAVGPRWDGNKAQECVSLLKRAVERSLTLAEEVKCQSIAMPAISSGIFGFPLDQCVATIVSAIKDNFQRQPDRRTLKKIYLVDISAKVAGTFAEAVETTYKAPLSPTASQSSLTALELVSPGETPQKPQTQDYVLVSPEGLKIRLVEEGVQNAKTDVIVTSIPSDLVLNKGPLSKALLEKAGPELQKELNEAGQGGSVKAGTILQTSGCNLNCHHVFHVVAPQWKVDNGAWSLKIMKNIIRDCLGTAEALSLQSIGFPAIGTGNLGFPKPEFAKLIISEVLKFSSKNQLKTLQEVQFLLHPKDVENIQAFSDEFDKRSQGNPSDTQGFYGSLSSPTLGVHEMNIGPILFQVATGDITKEVADVIVNSTSNTFNLKSGVSKAILEGAGPNVENECSVLAQQNSEYIVTEGGSLRCKSIIHVVGGNDVKRSVSCVLEECEQRNYSSICLPAIGTGSAQQDPNAVAKAIMNAIEEFIQKTSVQAVKKVKVVIFQPHILRVFYNNMKDREGSPAPPQPSLLSKITSFFGFSKHTPRKQNTLFLEKKVDWTIFQVCGIDEDNVERTISWIQNLINKEQLPYHSDDECVRDFGEKEYKKLNELQERLNIVIKLDQKTPLIKVTGISRDVTEARDEIENLIKSIRLAKEKESQADYVLTFVGWRYIVNNITHCFDKITNMQLEDARQAKHTSTVVKINNQDFTVNLRTNTATGPQGQSVTVQRILKDEAEIPSNWSDMGQKKLLVVSLQTNNPEYIMVANQFHQTCQNFIIENIQRIQNPALWRRYQANKKIMDEKNGHEGNEKQLFHGTEASSILHLNSHGFNRSYAGKNATSYGKGTYFAVHASYSANDAYSRPDANGKKYMYYVRVLTGNYTTGNQSLIVPPPRDPQNPTDLYDTVTDLYQNPSMFVVFYDNQAYPEYLITFRR